MAEVYVTKWVISRGIIVGKGKPRQTSRYTRRNLWEVELRGHRNGPFVMSLGSEVFLTLEEAKESARRLFERNLKDCRDALAAAEEAVELLQRGKLEVHDKPPRIQDVHAFGRPLLPRDG